MTPEDLMAEAWREVDTMTGRYDDLERLSQLRRERAQHDDGQPTSYNPLDLDNEIEEAHLDVNAAAMRVDSLTEEVRLGLIERGDLPPG